PDREPSRRSARDRGRAPRSSAGPADPDSASASACRAGCGRSQTESCGSWPRRGTGHDSRRSPETSAGSGLRGERRPAACCERTERWPRSDARTAVRPRACRPRPRLAATRRRSRPSGYTHGRSPCYERPGMASFAQIRGRVLAPDPTARRVELLADALVRIDADGVITSVEAAPADCELPETWPGAVIVPGFVDTHLHFPQTRVIGSASGPL